MQFRVRGADVSAVLACRPRAAALTRGRVPVRLPRMIARSYHYAHHHHGPTGRGETRMRG